MIKTFTKEEMLERWKRAYGLVASPGLSGMRDSTALDTYLLDEIDVWYDRLLLTAPPGLLPREDVAAEASAMWLTSNCAEVRLPGRGVRPLRLRMEGWTRETARFEEPGSVRASMQTLQWARATPSLPVAVLFPGRIEAHGFQSAEAHGFQSAEAPAVTLLEMVVRPKDGTYVLDTSLLPRRKN